MSQTQGYLPFESLVLVETPTTYQESRIDHAKRVLMYGRPKITPTAVQRLHMLTVPRPSPVLFEDRFVSVYPVIERFEYSIAIQPKRHLGLLTKAPNRVDDPLAEDQFHRIDQSSLFYIANTLAVSPYQVYGFITEVPDLTGPEWVEWVHPGPTPETQLFPFRQIRVIAPTKPQPFFLLSYQSPNWRIEAEVDSRPPDLASKLLPFRQITVIQPTLVIRVKATQVGFYFWTRNLGDVFDVDVSHFASDQIDFIVGEIGSPFFGWMVIVSPNTPLSINAPTPLDTANNPRTTF